MYQRLGKFDAVLERYYGQLFQAQMDKNWEAVDKLQRIIAGLEEREGQMEQNSEGLRDYERAVR